MPINPKKMVEYAFDLYDKCEGIPDNELQLRTVINRAYYGAFLVARDFAGMQNTEHKVHQEVIDYYRTRRIEEVSNKLNHLRNLRQKSDYKLKATISEKNAKTSCSKANAVINKIKGL